MKYARLGEDWISARDWTAMFGGAGSGRDRGAGALGTIGGLLYFGDPLNGTASADFILAQNAGTINAGAGNDFVLGDIGGFYADISVNDSFVAAANLDAALATWTTDENPLFGDDSIPHSTYYVVTAAATREYFSFTMNAGDTVTIDIDAGQSIIGSSTTTDTVVHLYLSSDLVNAVATNDDASSSTLGGEGSVSNFDFYLTFTAAVSGTYYIRIGEFDINIGDHSGVFEGDEEFLLNVSLTNHAINPVVLPGADTINGGDGVDHLFGVAGNDSIHGDAGGDRILGGSGNDSLFGDADLDTILGGVGDDSIEGGAGADFLDGGAGLHDLLSYLHSAAGVSVNLETGVVSGGDAAGDVIVGGSFEDLEGSALADTLTGNASANIISGGSGNDSILGGGGDDSLVGVSGVDTIDGGAGNDTIRASSSGGLYSGGADDDLMYSSSALSNMDGGTGNDTIDHTIFNSNYTFNMTTGLTQFGGESDTNFENAVMGNGADSVTGTTGANRIVGNGGNDTIIADAGNDTVEGGAGADNLSGGADIDTVSYANSAAGVNVILNSSTNTGGDAQGDILSGFENVIGSANDDALTGDFGTNVLIGGGGNDTLDAGFGGADVLDGGEGDDVFRLQAGSQETLTGGIGTDTLDYSAGLGSGGVYYYNLAAGGGVSLSSLGGNYFTHFVDAIENLVALPDSRDIVLGSADANLISTLALEDSINGAGGNDTLDGGTGNDTLLGGGDADSLLGDDGDDILVGGNGSDILKGGGENDRLNGGADIDTLQGGTGNDVLVDKAGGDQLEGGQDDDKYIIASATSVIVELLDEGHDTVKTGITYTLTDNVEDLQLLGGGNIDGTGNGLNNVISSGGGANLLRGLGGADSLFARGGNDTLQGGVGNDTLRGGSGSDLLEGGGNDDRLFGQKGNDTMTGGSGKDRFAITGDSQFDTITDFEDGKDRIELNDYRDENGGVALTFDQLLITQLGNGTARIQLDLDRNGIADVIDLDGDGTADAWRVDLLDTNVASLSAADFIF